MCPWSYGQNGEPVRPDHGFPLRLLVTGFEGIYNVKRLKTIKVVDQHYKTFQERSRSLSADRRQRHFIYELGPKSVITSPSGEDHLPEHGTYTITGLAWSGGGAVRRVEVSTDAGQTWTDAKLRGPALKRAFARFDLVWKWKGEEAVLQSRCTDELDQVQPSVAEFARFWNETESEIFRGGGSRFGHFNVIQSWKVATNGLVQNALETYSSRCTADGGRHGYRGGPGRILVRLRTSRHARRSSRGGYHGRARRKGASARQRQCGSRCRRLRVAGMPAVSRAQPC